MSEATERQLEYIESLKQSCLEKQGARLTRFVFEDFDIDIDDFSEISAEEASDLIGALKYLKDSRA